MITGCRRAVLAAWFALALTACVRQPAVPTQPGYRPTTVRDVEIFPQDLTWFARQAGGDDPLVGAAQSAAQAERFRKLFFAAWSVAGPGKDNPAFFKAELARQGAKRGYAENLQPWDDARWQHMNLNADWPHFPNLHQAAVTVRPTGLRLAPTSLPRFDHPARAGQGYPFDLFQQSALPVGFPLMVLHRSLDGAWYYVENSLAPGWIPAEDAAFVDEAQQALWRRLPLAAFVRDGVPLLGASGAFLAQAGIGAVLPLEEARPDGLRVLTPTRGGNGWAVMNGARVDSGAASRMPLPLTADRLAAVGNALLGQPYGWGGWNGDRDCSAMLRDMFTPFGFWLPRNSSAQARAGRYVDFSGLDSDAKEALIRREGEPFLTLLWLRGHIGLYVGDYQGQAAFFHNLWGLRTRDENGREGRHVLGRAVITSTRPGRELPQIPKDLLLLERMRGMNLLMNDLGGE